MRRKAILRRLSTIIRITREEVEHLAAAALDDSAAAAEIADLRLAAEGGEAEIELDFDQVQRLAVLESPLRAQLLDLVEEMVFENGPAPLVLLEEREDGSRLRAEIIFEWNFEGETSVELPADLDALPEDDVRRTFHVAKGSRIVLGIRGMVELAKRGIRPNLAIRYVASKLPPLTVHAVVDGHPAEVVSCEGMKELMGQGEARARRRQINVTLTEEEARRWLGWE